MPVDILSFSWEFVKKNGMADEILVINVGENIVSSTKSESEYAHDTGKPVRYLEEV